MSKEIECTAHAGQTFSIFWKKFILFDRQFFILFLLFFFIWNFILE
jgi:hypothetical protein